MNPKIKSNLIWIVLVLVCGLILYADSVYSKGNVKDSVCIDNTNSSIKISGLSTGLTMVQISDLVVEKQKIKVKSKDCFEFDIADSKVKNIKKK